MPRVAAVLTGLTGHFTMLVRAVHTTLVLSPMIRTTLSLDLLLTLPPSGRS